MCPWSMRSEKGGELLLDDMRVPGRGGTPKLTTYDNKGTNSTKPYDRIKIGIEVACEHPIGSVPPMILRCLKRLQSGTSFSPTRSPSISSVSRLLRAHSAPS